MKIKFTHTYSYPMPGPDGAKTERVETPFEVEVSAEELTALKEFLVEACPVIGTMIERIMRSEQECKQDRAKLELERLQAEWKHRESKDGRS